MSDDPPRPRSGPVPAGDRAAREATLGEELAKWDAAGADRGATLCTQFLRGTLDVDAAEVRRAREFDRRWHAAEVSQHGVHVECIRIVSAVYFEVLLQ